MLQRMSGIRAPFARIMSDIRCLAHQRAWAKPRGRSITNMWPGDRSAMTRRCGRTVRLRRATLRNRYLWRCAAALVRGCGLSDLLLRNSDQVGALARPRNAGEGHVGARHHELRILDEVVELLSGPGALLGFLIAGRIVEAGVGPLLAADDALEIGADQVPAALVEGVAGHALLGGVSPRAMSALASSSPTGGSCGAGAPFWSPPRAVSGTTIS